MKLKTGTNEYGTQVLILIKDNIYQINESKFVIEQMKIEAQQYADKDEIHWSVKQYDNVCFSNDPNCNDTVIEINEYYTVDELIRNSDFIEFVYRLETGFYFEIDK